MPGFRVEEVAGVIARLVADPQLRTQLGRAGVETAQKHAWERRIDALEACFQRVATARRMTVAGELAPPSIKDPT
jgi:glycosyltransferase involved in cell wall biosynthesis